MLYQLSYTLAVGLAPTRVAHYTRNGQTASTGRSINTAGLTVTA